MTATVELRSRDKNVCRKCTSKACAAGSDKGWACPWIIYMGRLEPELRRFVTSYSRRRPELSLQLRAQLASLLQANLQEAAPDAFMQNGPLAALDYLADLELDGRTHAAPTPATP